MNGSGNPHRKTPYQKMDNSKNRSQIVALDQIKIDRANFGSKTIFSNYLEIGAKKWIEKLSPLRHEK